jgi:hypothetical protein
VHTLGEIIGGGPPHAGVAGDGRTVEPTCRHPCRHPLVKGSNESINAYSFYARGGSRWSSNYDPDIESQYRGTGDVRICY